MCGIAGYWDLHAHAGAEMLYGYIAGMTQALVLRGPDSGGVWIEAGAGMALGHRRLALRELSPLGHQPMTSPDGRFVLTYNGEIYNTGELTEFLAQRGIHPRGASDTEIVLLACMTLGVDATLEHLLGMYAFALWDKKERHLVLARDRMGVKPLYWMRDGGRFCFASELKSLRTLEDWQADINHDALALLLRYGYIPAPHCIWRGAFKLPAAHRLDVNADGRIRLCRYWDPLAVACEGLTRPLPLSPKTEAVYVEELDALLTDAVRRRMVADVPVGAFLSGGIDSSLVTALMQKCSAAPVRTFSIGFEEPDYDEAPFAADVARHLGTCHTELYLSVKDAWNLIPHLPAIYDEPFADPSQIPTTLLSGLTRRHVITALTGDGGDELFGGYDRYTSCLRQMPDFAPHTPVRTAFAAMLRSLSPRTWDALARMLPAAIRPRNAGARLHNFADLRLHGSALAFYHRYYMQYWWHPSTLLTTGKAPATIADHTDLEDSLGASLPLMQYVDTRMYLAEDILTKVDRASMHHSLEARVPLLDTRVFAFAWRIPTTWRVRDGKGKYLLRRLLHNYVPPALVERPKMGFGIPVGEWLRGPLRPWAEALLEERRLREQNIFHPQSVRSAWERHVSEASNWEYLLWIVLMFQAWHAAASQPPAVSSRDIPAVFV